MIARMAEYEHRVLQIRCENTPGLGKRYKIMAAAAGLSYHNFLVHLLDKEESRLRRQRAQQRSPLHRPTPVDVGEDDEWSQT